MSARLTLRQLRAMKARWEKDLAKLETAWRAGLDDVTPGPWDVMTCNTVRAIDGDEAIPIFDARVPWKKHRRTSTAVKQEWHNARHVANCSPDNIRALLDALAARDTALSEMRAELERVKKALEPLAAHCAELDALGHADNSTCVWRLKASDIRAAARALAPSIQDEGGEL